MSPRRSTISTSEKEKSRRLRFSLRARSGIQTTISSFIRRDTAITPNLSGAPLPCLFYDPSSALKKKVAERTLLRLSPLPSSSSIEIQHARERGEQIISLQSIPPDQYKNAILCPYDSSEARYLPMPIRVKEKNRTRYVDQYIQLKDRENL